MKIVILDFGSQYTHLIKTTLLKMGYESDVVAGDFQYKDYLHQNEISGVILSGGAASVYDQTIDFDRTWLEKHLVLGICYGHQLIAATNGGLVEKSEKAEFGKANLTLIKEDVLLKDIPKESTVWMSHRDQVVELPLEFEVLGESDYSKIALFKKDNWYGVQFHPEVSHTEYGRQLLENFAKITNTTKHDEWTAENFVKNLDTKHITNKIIFALSGGVDSYTMAALLKQTLKTDLLAIYVDTGLMPDETRMEVESFCQTQQIPLKVVDASERFFTALQGKMRTWEKGKAIGELFIRIFEEEAKSFGAEYVAQGTIYSDVIESGLTKFSSVIKPHHNVGGLPDVMDIVLYEPLRDLFKDQVRQIAKYLNLPDFVVHKKVFPGPGFAIRVEGEVTPDKVAIVKQSTKIVEEVLSKNPEINNQIWMAFTVLINAPSLGVKGDEHVQNEHVIVIRAVESQNSMTAYASVCIQPLLPEMARRIVNETPIGRVVYDITDKPPATIEWQ